MYPKKFWHIRSWADHVIHVSLRAVFFRAPNFVKYLGKAFWKWDRRMELHDDVGLTLTCRGLLP